MKYKYIENPPTHIFINEDSGKEIKFDQSCVLDYEGKNYKDGELARMMIASFSMIIKEELELNDIAPIVKKVVELFNLNS